MRYVKLWKLIGVVGCWAMGQGCTLEPPAHGHKSDRLDHHETNPQCDEFARALLPFVNGGLEQSPKAAPQTVQEKVVSHWEGWITPALEKFGHPQDLHVEVRWRNLRTTLVDVPQNIPPQEGEPALEVVLFNTTHAIAFRATRFFRLRGMGPPKVSQWAMFDLQPVESESADPPHVTHRLRGCASSHRGGSESMRTSGEDVTPYLRELLIQKSILFTYLDDAGDHWKRDPRVVAGMPTLHAISVDGYGFFSDAIFGEEELRAVGTLGHPVALRLAHTRARAGKSSDDLESLFSMPKLVHLSLSTRQFSFSLAQHFGWSSASVTTLTVGRELGKSEWFDAQEIEPLSEVFPALNLLSFEQGSTLDEDKFTHLLEHWPPTLRVLKVPHQVWRDGFDELLKVEERLREKNHLFRVTLQVPSSSFSDGDVAVLREKFLGGVSVY